MSKRNAPYIFLLLLILFLMFMGGVKYGQKIEQANKVIRYVASITPTMIPPTVVPTKAVGYKQYASECGLSFLYPSDLSANVTGNDAIYADQFSKAGDRSNAEVLSVRCLDGKAVGISSDRFLSETEGDAATTTSVLIENKKITIYEKNSIYNVRLIHPMTGKFISISVEKNIYPLFERTVVFTRPVSPTAKPTVTSTKKPSATVTPTP